jgi:hypothetical protein
MRERTGPCKVLPFRKKRVRFESLRLGLLPNARFRSALPSVPLVRPT